MLPVAANITLLDWKLPLLERVADAARRGFDGVECLFPYAISQEAWAEPLVKSRQRMALINTPEPDWAKGARGCAAIPGETARFMTRFVEARKFAHALKCKHIHVMSGNTESPDAFDTLVENLRLAADWTPDCILTIEPLNGQDMPGYFLNDFDLAARVLDAVAMPNVALQFDAWHASRIHGDVRGVWKAHRDRVAHVQIAGLAARGAPDMSHPVESALLCDIVESGYDGWISAEFHPQLSDPKNWLEVVRTVLCAD